MGSFYLVFSAREHRFLYILWTKDTDFMALGFVQLKVNTIYNGVSVCSMHSTSTNWLRSNGLYGVMGVVVDVLKSW